MRRLTIAIAAVAALAACSEQKQNSMSVDDYKAEALATVSTYGVDTALELVNDNSVVFVDLREGDEIAATGMIQGAIHVPRGVLEFYIDPQNSMHDEVFSSGKQLIFYCSTGGRSLLAAKLASDMGLSDPVYLEGGFQAWSDAGGLIVPEATD